MLRDPLRGRSTSPAASAPANPVLRGGFRARAVHVHRPGRPRRARRVLAEGAGHRRRAGDRRVDVHARAGRTGEADDRRRGGRRQLEPDRAQRSVHGLRQSRRRRGRSTLTAGEAHTLEVEFVPPRGLGGLEIGCRPPSPPDLMDRAVALARRADAVVCVVGTDNDWETEGNDRGIDGAAAAAGRARPRGRRGEPRDRRRRERGVAGRRCRGPTTSPRSCRPGSRARSGATPSPTSCRATCRPRASCPRRSRCASRTRPRSRTIPASAGQVRYGEGVFVGYRWYDARRDRAALLLRSRAVVHDVRARCADVGRFEALQVRVTNTGHARGAETVQCYVHDVEASVARPQQELKAFAKVWLDPGESRDVGAPARRARVRVLGRRRARVDGGTGRRSSCGSAPRHATSRTASTIERA